jgi:RNA polymerase sigma-70 factor (ECF subfamily)
MPPSDASDAPAKRARFEAEAVPHLGALYGAARRLCRDDDEAGDLVQETCLRAYRTFDNFRAGTNCRAWLFTILYSVFINRRRKLRREQPMPADALDALFSRHVEQPLPAEEDMAPDVVRALEALPEPFRLAVMLVDVQDFSHEDAAAALECPVTTLRTRLFRGRRLLFGALREYGREQGFTVEDAR